MKRRNFFAAVTGGITTLLGIKEVKPKITYKVVKSTRPPNHALVLLRGKGSWSNGTLQYVKRYNYQLTAREIK